MSSGMISVEVGGVSIERADFAGSPCKSRQVDSDGS
jgi:hypothetical protein